MDIVIYGTGAIGSVLATLLKQAHSKDKNTIHLVGRKHILDKIDKNGLIYVPYGSDEEIVTSGYETYEKITDIESADVVIFTMKAYGLRASCRTIKQWIQEQDPIIILSMNGLGLKEIVREETGSDNILEISVGYPSRLEGNKVINTGGNSVFIAPNDEDTRSTFEKMFGFIDEGIPIQFKDNFQHFKWRKGTANITMNGISAITMLTVGEVLERQTLCSIMDRLIQETVAVAQELGMPLTMDVKEWFYEFAGKDPHHKTSTFQDILKNKRTEIEFFNGYIVKKGRKLGIPTPINECLLKMMHAVEDDFD